MMDKKSLNLEKEIEEENLEPKLYYCLKDGWTKNFSTQKRNLKKKPLNIK